MKIKTKILLICILIILLYCGIVSYMAWKEGIIFSTTYSNCEINNFINLSNLNKSIPLT